MATSSLDWGAEAEKEEKEMAMARKVNQRLGFTFLDDNIFKLKMIKKIIDILWIPFQANKVFHFKNV
jgi:hypothetical protein